uniref:Uncharacterized protein n=2 Tax=viral metagenome TaxID=1070528 RepID=A0A6M3L609_9ZZZZ
MEGQELTVQHAEVGIFVPPEIVLENARTAARALSDVLSNKKKPVIMNGEQYLEFEDWQTCGQFYGYTVKTGDAMPVEVDGVKGAKASADIIDIHTGMYLGGAEAYCMRDEDHWNTRPKYEWQGEGENRKRVKVGDEIVPWFQLASMAQTRAGSKALRNRLAWVVVLAGYKATPAEEMTESTVGEKVKERRTVDKSAHYCSVHDVNFFKKGKMRGYSHPIEGTNDWCNEDDQKKQVIEEGEKDIKEYWPEETSVEQEPRTEPEKKVSLSQLRRIKELIGQTGVSINDVKVHVGGKFGKVRSEELTYKEAQELILDLGDFKVEKIKTEEISPDKIPY